MPAAVTTAVPSGVGTIVPVAVARRWRASGRPVSAARTTSSLRASRWLCSMRESTSRVPSGG
ncbi:hypothetical protein [Nonomuraea salmonea]|uniref:hypothetical protein n=1 Tax=Nonomuraea salmonea TaxID=46181 RepID=UPI0031E5AF79